jgi:hypothetical protein
MKNTGFSNPKTNFAGQEVRTNRAHWTIAFYCSLREQTLNFAWFWTTMYSVLSHLRQPMHGLQNSFLIVKNDHQNHLFSTNNVQQFWCFSTYLKNHLQNSFWIVERPLFYCYYNHNKLSSQVKKLFILSLALPLCFYKEGATHWSLLKSNANINTIIVVSDVEYG